MSSELKFSNRKEFRDWLEKNSLKSEGVWLLFGKKGGPETLSANEALEEALCYGWIDGQMQSIDGKIYKKYFSIRRKNSKWSDKNKTIAEKLEKNGLMTPGGKAKIEEARKNGQWDAVKPEGITDKQIAELAEILKKYKPAYSNFMGMSPSVKKTYTRAYFDAKTDEGRAKRLSWMTERLNKNLKAM